MTDEPVVFADDEAEPERRTGETQRVDKVEFHGIPAVKDADKPVRCDWGKRLFCRTTCQFYEEGLSGNCQLTNAAYTEKKLRMEAEEREKTLLGGMDRMIHVVSQLEARVTELIKKYEGEPKDDTPVPDPDVDSSAGKPTGRKNRSRAKQ